LEQAGVVFPMPSPTNILIFASADPPGQVAQLAERGVLVVPFGPGLIRAVFHRDISDEDLDYAIHHSLGVLASA
jgi:hypothetical protein